MSLVTCQISTSLDGFAAGPNQSLENPLGEGGERLHEWAIATDAWRAQHRWEGGEHNADAEVIADVTQNVGAYIMGRKMFGGGHGPHDESWRGWGGERPPPFPRPRPPPPPPRGGAAAHGGRHDVHLRDRGDRVRARTGARSG